jgi:pimeloyl-ACP methyl ester carboxylesterase
MTGRRLLLGVLAVCALALAGCGSVRGFVQPGMPSGPEAPPSIPGMTPVTVNERLLMPKSVAMGRVGEGLNSVIVMRRADAPPDQPLLIWLHGYGTASVSSQEKWLLHLTRRATVVFPIYTEFPYPVGPRFGQIAWPIVARALRRTLPKLEYDPRKVVVGGYSLGGGLANDYAANWRVERLPKPYGLFAVFSGRALEKGDVMLPRQRGSISPDTDVVQMASPNDLLAGVREASFVIAKTPRSAPRRLIIVRDYAYNDHFAPTRTTRAERRIFWTPLDELIDRVDARAERAQARGPAV